MHVKADEIVEIFGFWDAGLVPAVLTGPRQTDSNRKDGPEASRKVTHKAIERCGLGMEDDDAGPKELRAPVEDAVAEPVRFCCRRF
jgi:hypothetical protein